MTLVADLNTSVSVPFSRWRQMLEDSALQEGAVGATDLKVSQRAAGANMSVDVAVGQAWVQIDTGTRNGLGHVVNDATANVAVTASNATNPRVDQVVLQWNETAIPTGAGDVPTLRVLAGTATAGATLDNRTGAAALGNDRMLLADLLIPAASTSVTAANIRDRRAWARGASRLINYTGGNVTTSSATYIQLSSALSARLECSGGTMELRLRASVNLNAAGSIWATPWVDGASMGTDYETNLASISGNADIPVAITIPFVIGAGSHTFSWAYRNSAGIPTWRGAGAGAGMITAQYIEIVRQNADNS